MYLPYLMFGYAATVMLMIAGCYAISRTLPGLPGLRLLIGALFCGLGGVLLLASRPFAPAWATIVVANGLIFLSSFLIYCATAEIVNIPTFGHSWGVPVLGAALAGLLYFTYVHPSLIARIYICSGCFAVFAAARSVILFAHRDPVAEEVEPQSSLHPLLAALAWLQVAIVAVQAARIVLTALYPPVEIVHMDIIQSGATYLNLILNAGAGFGLIWLAQALHRRELNRMAQTDSLTGLLNRRAFEEILARELRRSQHGATPLAILLVDIDRFKNVNDTWGHQAGDVVIRRVGMALRNNLRPGDALSRFGGEEYLILLRDATAEQSAEVAERICANIAALAELPGDVRLTVSIGVAQSHGADTPDELLRRCDQAMYLSKEGGRNLVTVDRSQVRRADPAPTQISAQTAKTYS